MTYAAEACPTPLPTAERSIAKLRAGAINPISAATQRLTATKGHARNLYHILGIDGTLCSCFHTAKGKRAQAIPLGTRLIARYTQRQKTCEHSKAYVELGAAGPRPVIGHAALLFAARLRERNGCAGHQASHAHAPINAAVHANDNAHTPQVYNVFAGAQLRKSRQAFMGPRLSKQACKVVRHACIDCWLDNALDWQ